MAVRFVAGSGSNTSPYDTWAKAATSTQTALTESTAVGDIVVIDMADIPAIDSASMAADTTYTFAANGVLLVGGVNLGGSSWSEYTPAAGGAFLGHPTANFSITFSGAFSVQLRGLGIRLSGGGLDLLTFAGADGSQQSLDNCYLSVTNSSASSRIVVGSEATGRNAWTQWNNVWVRFGAAGQAIGLAGPLRWNGGGVDAAGVAPTFLFKANNNARDAELTGVDTSPCAGLLDSSSNGSVGVTLFQCKVHATSTGRLATQSPANLSAGRLMLADCSNGDAHGLLEYHDSYGSLTTDAGIYRTASAAAVSLKITTTSLASRWTPFVTPPIFRRNTTTGSALTPAIEVARDGSATAYTDAELFAEWMLKTTAGSTQSSRYTDEAALQSAGTAQATGVGTGSWTGLSGTAWSGKLAPAAQTLQESGDMVARVFFGAPSSVVYVDPNMQVA